MEPGLVEQDPVQEGALAPVGEVWRMAVDSVGALAGAGASVQDFMATMPNLNR